MTTPLLWLLWSIKTLLFFENLFNSWHAYRRKQSIIYCLTNWSDWFYEQALAPKEKDSMDNIGSEVDDEINATAEVSKSQTEI